MNKLKRILLVEDSENDIELTTDALKQYNLANNIDYVHDGEEALDYLLYRGQYKKREHEEPILILLDIKLPKLDGIEVLRVIKRNEKLKTIPTVMLTSSKEESDKIRSYMLGVNAYIIKPVEFHKFVDAVKHLGIFWAVIIEPPTTLNSKKEKK
jgi:DNA-binding response OmpR family regulator